MRLRHLITLTLVTFSIVSTRSAAQDQSAARSIEAELDRRLAQAHRSERQHSLQNRTDWQRFGRDIERSVERTVERAVARAQSDAAMAIRMAERRRSELSRFDDRQFERRFYRDSDVQRLRINAERIADQARANAMRAADRARLNAERARIRVMERMSRLHR